MVLSPDRQSSLAALFAAFREARLTDTHRAIRLRLSSAHRSLEHVLLPQRIELRERLYGGLKGTVTCLSTQAGIPLKTFVGLPVELQLVTDRGEIRRFCGIVQAAKEGASDSGLTVYQLTVVDALAVLEGSVTTRVFRNQSVPDIAQVVLNEARQRSPGLARAFEIDLSGLSAERYPQRAFTLQYNESKAAFVRRLLKRAGISWVIRPGPAGDARGDDDTPVHTLVCFDDGMALPQCAAGSIRFQGTQRHVERSDSVDLFTAIRRLVPGSGETASWDYQSGRMSVFGAPTGAHQGEDGDSLAAGLDDYRIESPHWGDTLSDFTRLSDLRLLGHAFAAKCYVAESNVRALPAGAWFGLTGHPQIDTHPPEQREFLVLDVTHCAENNLPKALQDRAQALFTASRWPSFDERVTFTEGGARYRNRFTCVRRGTPIVPAFDPRTELPRPPLMTALVVGPEGEVVHTDPYGRVKVQFQGLRPHEHEHQKGAGTAGTDADSAWVRVAVPTGGPDRGFIALPRGGDEVLIGWIGDDPDKPVILGSVYSDPRRPPNFSGAGSLPGNRHPSGLKSQEIGGSDYNQVCMDDTTGQVSVQVASTHGRTELNKGFLTHPRRDGKAQPRGEGFELRTDLAGALRTAQALLITSFAQLAAKGSQLDCPELRSSLQVAHDLVKSLADAALDQGAEAADLDPQQQLKTALAQWEQGSNTAPDGSGGGEPIIALSGAAGLVAATPRSSVHYAGETLDLVAGNNLQQAARKRFIAKAGELMSLFVLGVRQAATAFKLIVARGNLQFQAHDGSLEHSATETIRIEAGKQTVMTTAKGPVRVGGGDGCGFQMAGGNIEFHCPGTFTIKTTLLQVEEGAHASAAMDAWDKTAFDDVYVVRDEHTGEPLRNTQVELLRDDGARMELTTDAEGRLPKQQAEWIDRVVMRAIGKTRS